MNKTMALRDAYGHALKKLGQLNSRVVALEADVGGSTKSIIFGTEFPQRYYNVGIAEMNMAAMAAGMASCGDIPFVNTFAAFLVSRGADPVQSLIAYDKLNVKLAGTYCGMSDSYDGASHHSITDIAFMRALPNMTVVSVCDPIETEKAVFAAAAYNGPVYLRLSRAPSPYIFNDNYEFRLGEGVVLREGSDLTLVATGYMVHKALEASLFLEKEGIQAAVIDIHTIEPIDKQLLMKYAGKTGAIVTIEEHSIHGGLGSAVAETVAEYGPVPVRMMGLERFAESGDYEQLLSIYGLDAKAIIQTAGRVIAQKHTDMI